MAKQGKSNKFAFMQYEESLPIERLRGFLVANHYSAVISPLHDSDVWTIEDVDKWIEARKTKDNVTVAEGAKECEIPTGEYKRGSYGQPVPVTRTVKVPQVGDLKKPHRHVYVEYDYSKPLSAALNDFRNFGIEYLEPVRSRSAYIRYLCHLDDEDKARYAVDDVICVGGCDISPLFVLTQVQSTMIQFNVMDFIAEEHVNTFTRLLDGLRAAKMISEFQAVTRNWGMWREYIRMKRFVYTVDGVDFDGATGEVLESDGEYPHDPVENDGGMPDAA